eukprot:s787_g5.t1
MADAMDMFEYMVDETTSFGRDLKGVVSATSAIASYIMSHAAFPISELFARTMADGPQFYLSIIVLSLDAGNFWRWWFAGCLWHHKGKEAEQWYRICTNYSSKPTL